MTLSKMETDLSQQLADPAADLNQPQPEGVELHTRDAKRQQPASERIEQPVRSGMQKQPKLIGPEAMATQSIGEAAPLEILDPLLGFSAVSYTHLTLPT